MITCRSRDTYENANIDSRFCVRTNSHMSQTLSCTVAPDDDKDVERDGDGDGDGSDGSL